MVVQSVSGWIGGFRFVGCTYVWLSWTDWRSETDNPSLWITLFADDTAISMEVRGNAAGAQDREMHINQNKREMYALYIKRQEAKLTFQR